MPKAIKLTMEIINNPIKATIIMVILSSVVILFQGISLSRSPVTTLLIPLSEHCSFYFTPNNFFHDNMHVYESTLFIQERIVEEFCGCECD